MDCVVTVNNRSSLYLCILIKVKRAAIIFERVKIII